MAPNVPVVARTKPENTPSQRTAVKIGLRRRPELEVDDETGPVVIYASSWPHWKPTDHLRGAPGP